MRAARVAHARATVERSVRSAVRMLSTHTHVAMHGPWVGSRYSAAVSATEGRTTVGGNRSTEVGRAALLGEAMTPLDASRHSQNSASVLAFFVSQHNCDENPGRPSVAGLHAVTCARKASALVVLIITEVGAAEVPASVSPWEHCGARLDAQLCISLHARCAQQLSCSPECILPRAFAGASSL